MIPIHNTNPSPKEAVDTLEGLQGKFPGARRAHAKGQFYKATFKPNGNAIPYTTAPHLQKEEVPVTVRFSNAPPNPSAADYLSPAKGMAVQFHLPDGTASHLIGTTIPFFVTEDPKTFIDMLKIVTSEKTGIHTVDLGLGIAKVLAKYPERKHIFQALMEQMKQPPASYASLNYYPIHAFYFVNEAGKRQAIKYEWKPVEIEGNTEKKAPSNDFLFEELEERLANKPVVFDLIIRLGEENDSTDDPTDPWPSERQRIIVGQLTLEGKVSPREDLLFDPTVVGPGIELTEDKILHYRHVAYAESFTRRMNNL